MVLVTPGCWVQFPGPPKCKMYARMTKLLWEKPSAKWHIILKNTLFLWYRSYNTLRIHCTAIPFVFYIELWYLLRTYRITKTIFVMTWNSQHFIWILNQTEIIVLLKKKRFGEMCQNSVIFTSDIKVAIIRCTFTDIA